MRNALLIALFLLFPPAFSVTSVSAQTLTPSPLPSLTVTATATEFPMPVCTPPPCPDGGQLVCGIEGGCPGGCGTICLLPQPPTQPVPIPEPMTILLFGAGIAGLSGYVAKRRR